MLCRGFFGNSGFGYFNGGGMIFMMGFGLLIFLTILFLVFKLAKPNTLHNFQHQDNSALNILNERLAKGEINEEEYAKIKATLNK